MGVYNSETCKQCPELESSLKEIFFWDTAAFVTMLLFLSTTNSNCGKNMYMMGDLNEDLLKVNRLEQILNKQTFIN